jgi:hypothetical protein
MFQTFYFLKLPGLMAAIWLLEIFKEVAITGYPVSAVITRKMTMTNKIAMLDGAHHISKYLF